MLLTFVIVGGGPTGVELAGSLATLMQKPLAKDYPDVNLGRARILLVEAMDRLLPAFSAESGAYAALRLRELGIEVLTGAMVAEVRPTAIRLQDGREIASDAVVWVAGVRGRKMPAGSGLPTTEKGTVAVDRFLRVNDDPHVMVTGDLVHLESDGRPVPMVARAAVQEGRQAAENILRAISGRPLKPFTYRELGSMAAVGRGRAVADIKGVTITGALAWPAWAVVHIGGLIGFRDRLSVMLNWAGDYFFAERVHRLILPYEQAAATEPAEQAKEEAR